MSSAESEIEDAPSSYKSIVWQHFGFPVTRQDEGFATAVLTEKQKMLEIASLKLIIDVATRWNSSMDMLERYLVQHAAITATLLSTEVRKNAHQLDTQAYLTVPATSVPSTVICVIIMASTNLVGKKGANSPIWQYFGFRTNERGQPRDTSEVVCRICGQVIRAKDAQTTNLHDHLRVHHPAEYSSLPVSSSRTTEPRRNQPTVSEVFAKITKYKRERERWKQCTDAVTRYLAKEMVSFNTVEKSTFKAMLQTFDKQYELPGRKYFSKTAVPKMYNDIRANILAELDDVEYLALTTDMWSSCNMMPYMSVTAHYVSKEWTLKSKCLQTSFMPESHTPDNLEEALQESIHEWKIEEKKISCITTDNGANVIAAIRQLKLPWLSCFGHNLNIAINNSLKKQQASTDQAFGVCRAVNTAFSHSWWRRRELSKAQEELKLPQHSLITVIFKTLRQ
ncbi:E3 SUMO-protein ligase ZBED1 [Labeo rohita]|uniref:E3 SUMO-protein ligase ZBED1 n=1 Tax=Labeo rohita TaxID=84645 RepID=A0ABQ8MGS1_LABRO|nr:E3 SUMO-protein ligase ZBED1 [Labeo rohita]